MEIKINSSNLDVTLEKEESLGEVIPQIKNWLLESGMHIKEVFKDGEPLYIENTGSWETTSISSVKDLEITAITESEKYVDDLQVVYQYVTMLNGAVETGNSKLIKDLLEDKELIAGSLDYLFASGIRKTHSTQFLKVTEEAFPEGGGGENTDKLKEYLKSLSFLLQKRIEEVADPVRAMKTAALALKELIPDISEVSILLQTGRDQQAYGSVIAFIEISETLIRVFSILKEAGLMNSGDISVDGISFDSFYSGFNEILKELAEAFDSSDTVLIGDLLEYEIVPKIDTLLEFIALIEKKQE